MRWPSLLSGGARRGKYPVRGEAGSVLIDPGQPNTSAMFLRMRSRNPSSQMPPLGTVLRDQTAVDALSRWITGDLAALARERRF